MDEYSFKDHNGNETLIRGEQLNTTEVRIGSGPLSEYGPKCHVKIYQTVSGNFIATVEYDPGKANQKRGVYWAGIIPETGRRPDVRSLDDLRVELITASEIGTFFQSPGLDDGVKRAVQDLFPRPGPRVID